MCRQSYFLLLVVSLTAGCSICSPGYLDNYAAVGGKWQRADQTHGRVGSILSDTGSTISNSVMVDDGQGGYQYGEVYDEYYQDIYTGSQGYISADEYSTAPGYDEGFIGQGQSGLAAPENQYQGESILEGSY